MKKYLIFAFSALLLIGCTNNQVVNEEKEEIKQEEIKQETKNEKDLVQQEEEGQETVSQEIEVNEELTKALENEKSVSKGNVYEKDNIIYGTFILEEQTAEEDITKLIDKYTNELKDTYKDQKINVMAVQGGQVVQEQTIPVDEPVVEEGQTLAKDLNGEVLNILIGVYAIKVDLEEAEKINATDSSELVLELSETDHIVLDYNEEGQVFFGTIQDNYTKYDILNSKISVK